MLWKCHRISPQHMVVFLSLEIVLLSQGMKNPRFSNRGFQAVEKASQRFLRKQKILLRLQVWNLSAISRQMMRAADCKELAESPEGDFRQAQIPGFRTGDLRFYMWCSSACANMGQQTCTTWGLFRRILHSKSLLFCNRTEIIAHKLRKSTDRTSSICAAAYMENPEGDLYRCPVSIVTPGNSFNHTGRCRWFLRRLPGQPVRQQPSGPPWR